MYHSSILKRGITYSLLLICLTFFNSCKSLLVSKKTPSYPESKLGWKLGAQVYTFNRFNFFQAVDKIDSCKLQYVEAYPGQILGGGIEGKMDHRMENSKRLLVLEGLKHRGVQMKSYGVVRIKGEKDWRRLFEFCKYMGIETITSEPLEQDIPMISKLCDEFKINVAIHNHPVPSRYWNPDVVLAVLQGQSKRMGACADVGHWIRSGLDPIESLKKLEGRVLHLHMKDLNEKNTKKAHDVHWGTGVANIKGIASELKRQKFKGIISVEYEYNWFNSRADVAASVEYFRSIL